MTTKNTILEKLGGGDHRSIGRANEVVAEVLEDPMLFAQVFNGLLDETIVLIETCVNTGSPAVRNRGQKLLVRLRSK